MPRTRSGWKAYERRVARDLGVSRVPIGARTATGADPGDVALPGWYVEVRDRSRPLPLFWWQEVQEKAKGTGRKPLLVFRAPGSARGALALLLWRDLREVIRAYQGRGDHPEVSGAVPPEGDAEADGASGSASHPSGGTPGAPAWAEDS